MSSTLSITRARDRVVSSPRGRRLRRWSFVLTLPAALASALVLGVGTGLALLAGRVALWLAIRRLPPTGRTPCHARVRRDGRRSR